MDIDAVRDLLYDMDGDGSICHGRVRLRFVDALVQGVRTSSYMICIFELLIRILWQCAIMPLRFAC